MGKATQIHRGAKPFWLANGEPALVLPVVHHCCVQLVAILISVLLIPCWCIDFLVHL